MSLKCKTIFSKAQEFNQPFSLTLQQSQIAFTYISESIGTPTLLHFLLLCHQNPVYPDVLILQVSHKRGNKMESLSIFF